MNGRNKADGTNELEERLNQYIVSERTKAVNDLADEEQISAEVLNHYMKEYDYLQKEQPVIVERAFSIKNGIRYQNISDPVFYRKAARAYCSGCLTC